MSKTRNFMWPWQEQFLSGARALLRELFRAIDPGHKHKLTSPTQPPTLLLLGFLLADQPDLKCVCVHPDNCKYSADILAPLAEEAIRLHLSRFNDRICLGQYLVSEDMFPSSRRVAQETIWRDLRDAICHIVERTGNHPVAFCSEPGVVGDYLVFVIVLLSRRVRQSLPRLEKLVHDVRFFPSLLDAAVDKLLDAIALQLNPENPGQDPLFGKIDLDGIRRIAGQNLTPIIAIHRIQLRMLHRLFHHCNTIASLRYEGEEGSGQLLIAKPNHPNLKTEIEFSIPVSLTDHRAVRKILQTCSKNLHMLSDDGSRLFGLGNLQEKYNPERKDLFVIHFVKHNVWRFCHGEQPLMLVENGIPSLPRDGLDLDVLKRRLASTFQGITREAVYKLTSLATEASIQKHGTILVVSRGASDEAKRLGGRCIKPIELSPEILRSVTSIDGAVMLDFEGKCHAIGVILDGRAWGKGSGSRGARFNSAVRYVKSQDYPCLAMVVSDDGMINLLSRKRGKSRDPLDPFATKETDHG